MKNINLFTEEEKLFLNKVTENELKETVKRENILKTLKFSKAASNKDDADIIELVDGVYGKISSFSDDEWDKIVKNMPFSVSISSDDVTEDIDFNETFKNTYNWSE